MRYLILSVAIVIALSACRDEEYSGMASDGNENAANEMTVERADIDKDGIVDEQDLSIVASHFGQDPAGSAASEELKRVDVNGDNKVNILDLVVVSRFVGQRVPQPPVPEPTPVPEPPMDEQLDAEPPEPPPTMETPVDPNHYGQYRLVGKNGIVTYNVRIEIENDVPTSLTLDNPASPGIGIKILLSPYMGEGHYHSSYNNYNYEINWQNGMLQLLHFAPINDSNESGKIYIRGGAGLYHWEIDPDAVKAAFGG